MANKSVYCGLRGVCLCRYAEDGLVLVSCEEGTDILKALRGSSEKILWQHSAISDSSQFITDPVQWTSETEKTSTWNSWASAATEVVKGTTDIVEMSESFVSSTIYRKKMVTEVSKSDPTMSVILEIGGVKMTISLAATAVGIGAVILLLIALLVIRWVVSFNNILLQI